MRRVAAASGESATRSHQIPAKETAQTLRHPHASALRPEPVENDAAPAASAGSAPPPATVLPEIHVHHNRKIHLSPDGALPPNASSSPASSLTPDFDSASTASAIPSPVQPPERAPERASRPPRLAETNLPPAEILPALYTRNGRLIMPPALKGSHGILVHQNEMADQEGLVRVQDDADLELLRERRQLVAIPASAALAVDERLPLNRRFCRPWTAQFLYDLSRVHSGRFHRSLQVNSAVRTVEYQRHLERVNGNAAPAEGDDASPHLTGATIDIAKKGLSMEEVGWMRAYLAPLQAAGKIDVEEEFYQSCFHITVYRSYRPAAQIPSAQIMEAKSKDGKHHSGSAAVLATGVQ